MADEAETGIQKKISEVESEQGSLSGVGAEPLPDFGHGSAPSAGTSGTMIPGGGGKK
jgi:hypothetical protein